MTNLFRVTTRRSSENSAIIPWKMLTNPTTRSSEPANTTVPAITAPPFAAIVVSPLVASAAAESAAART